MIKKSKCFYRVSIKALISDTKNKVLLVQEDDGRWELPGGGLEFKENIVQGLKRELKEEIGVDIKTISKQPLYVWKQKSSKNKMYYYLFLGYKIKPKSFDFKKTKEAVDIQFFSKKEMKNIRLHPNLKKFFKLFDPKDFK